MPDCRPQRPAGPLPGAARFPDRPLLPGALLFGLVLLAFLPTLRQGFITYDDPVYVTENAHVKGGLTWAGAAWAATSTEASNWHPLTWISHMADCSLFGLEPWGHHLTSVLLHALNALLLFIALRRMTGAGWRSLLVAALFGLHPLHVESVAWVSERKDVLSTAFWMLVLLAYAARDERLRRLRPGSRAYYVLSLLLFGLGLMCKPMLVTLPCVLLLLDYWPLDRWGRSARSGRWLLVAEKIPFLLLGAAASMVTLAAQRGGEALGSVEDFPIQLRVSNALLAYCGYLGKFLLPRNLCIFYPIPVHQPPLWEPVLAAGLLAGVTAAAIALARRKPYLLVGWLWFVGTLVPVIGLVQVGGQSMADRYTYVPLVGIFIMAAWGLADLAGSRAAGQQAAGILSAAAVAVLAALTVGQLRYWRDGVTLFRHAIAVTEDNWIAHANLYATLSRSSSPAASAELRQTLSILADFAQAHETRGNELLALPGRRKDAIKEYRAAIRIMPDLAEPHNRLGAALAGSPGGIPEAIEEFRTAVRLNPDFADAHYDLGVALSGGPGIKGEAVSEFEAAARLNPANAQAHYNLAFLLSKIPGCEGQAVSEYEAVIRLSPDNFQAQFNLGLLLSQIPGRIPEAIGHFEAVLRVRPDLRQARDMIERLRAANPEATKP
ncbi:MAG TPA: tetratricopeptide repeat protein [Opitutaceae bacterium]